LIVQLKDNQPTLRETVETVASAEKPVDTATTTNGGHGRNETRAVAVFDAHKAVAETEWRGLVSSIIKVTRIVHRKIVKTGLWDTTTEIAYYLSTKPAPASAFAHGVRDHWGVENRNHYPRDVSFREDDSRIRDNPGVFARLRSFAYNILSASKPKSLSFPQARLKTAFRGVEGWRELTVT
jgi:predicted transposase YbfD/YdcC